MQERAGRAETGEGGAKARQQEVETQGQHLDAMGSLLRCEGPWALPGSGSGQVGQERGS